ncbi:MAG TPA: hypothetical protein VG323_00800 [Thermoanaerobaculia bacterium]|nr:hypothetical protein [Thermoanaerobaculia bacterium]
MKSARFGVALLSVVIGAAAFYYFCLLPYRCNRIESIQTAAIAVAFRNATSTGGRIMARRNLDALWPCRAASCRSVGIDMLLAANYRILGEEQEAILCYRDALRLDRRPEIYLNLARAELAAGDRSSAREHFLRSALFNPWMLESIEDGAIRQEVVQRLIASHPEAAADIRYIDSVVLP